MACAGLLSIHEWETKYLNSFVSLASRFCEISARPNVRPNFESAMLAVLLHRRAFKPKLRLLKAVILTPLSCSRLLNETDVVIVFVEFFG